jgi:glycosyltransferase involved in cell wall biosynthesis
MHILISAVSSALQPSGICRHAANLATALANASEALRVTLLVGRWQVAYFRTAFGLSNTPIAILPVDVAINPLARNAWYYYALPTIARERGAHILHLSFPAPIRRSLFRCPLVLSLHDLYPYDAPNNFGYFRVLFNRAFLRQALRAADAVVCSSNFTLDRLRRYAPGIASQKATRIYQSVTLDLLTEDPPAAPLGIARPFLLAVAQHRRNKNLDILISAFALYRRRRADQACQLVIVGSQGPETSALQSLVKRLSLRKHMLFLSGITDAELCWLYCRCEFLVVPSSIEGFCLPLAEVLHCGSRALCSDIPILREIGESRCDYFSLKQGVSGLANAMEAVSHTPLPTPHISDRFGRDEIARQYLTLYSRLVSGSDQPAPSVQPCHECVQ